MFHKDVADQIHRIEHADVNCYVIQDGPRVMLVDAGLPAMWKLVVAALRQLGRSPRDISALVLTHGHFDHVGFAARLNHDLDVPVYVHPDDARLAAHPYSYRHERNRLMYPVRYPRSIPVLTGMALAGALGVRGVQDVATLDADAAASFPGRPEPLHTPGHTEGHCSLYFRERGALLAGDALVTLDPYTGERGPQIVAGAATANSRRALDSLSALADTGAEILLPGHGDPYRGPVAAAVAMAREKGAH